MLGIYFLGFLYCVSAQQNVTDPPEYVQSKAAFAHARIYLQERVPYEERDITNSLARSHFAYGIFAEVTRVLVREFVLQQPESYDPIEVLYTTVPRAWEDYNKVSNTLGRLLDETYNKISVVTAKIDSLCGNIESVDDCNCLVHSEVQKSGYYVKQRARLLLALAKPALKLRAMEEDLNAAARKFTVVPYLLQHLESEGYREFIGDLAHVALLLREDI